MKTSANTTVVVEYLRENWRNPGPDGPTMTVFNSTPKKAKDENMSGK